MLNISSKSFSFTNLAEELSIDSMVYQEVSDLEIAIVSNSRIKHLDLSCFTGNYVTGNVTHEYLNWLEETHLS